MTFPPALLAVLACVALAAFGAIGALAGALWMQARASAALRRAGDDRAHLLALADHWVWETDAAHRLTLWRAPSQRPGAWRSAPALGSLLADVARPVNANEWCAPDASPLARQMAAHAPIACQRAALGPDTDARPWTLRGEPRHDGAGRFIGYIGSAVPVGETEDAEFGNAALAQLLPQLDAVVLLFRRADDASPWRLAARTHGGKALPGLVAETSAAAADDGAREHDAPDWASACGQLPADVAQALAQMPAGETRAVGDVRVSWSAVGAPGDAQAGRLVVLRPAEAAPAAGAPANAEAAPVVDVADHESFIYSVSHDLRAPIRVVEGFARILKEDYGRFLDRIGNDHTDRILAAAARMNSMIDALLALSRLQSQPIKRQPVDLSQLARYILEDLRSAEPEREAEITIEPGLVIQGDPTLIRIAIENLVGNAWKYSGQSPHTRIALRRETQGEQAVYVVEDAGAGFDMRFADRLFGVFQRLHSAKDFQGTGVGLASVRRIIRRHGGDIWAESEVGKGARFYFTLP
jgi:signal transduction histidine kinase